jgi:GxxExxY protein
MFAEFATAGGAQHCEICYIPTIIDAAIVQIAATRIVLGSEIVERDCVDALTEKVIACAIAVHREVGPGLLESVYRDCLLHELISHGLHVERERRMPIEYRGQRINTHLKIDLVVEQSVVVEVKAVEQLHPLHQAQVITYLKLSGYPAGLLINFNTPTLRASLRRLNHPDRYATKTIARIDP